MTRPQWAKALAPCAIAALLAAAVWFVHREPAAPGEFERWLEKISASAEAEDSITRAEAYLQFLDDALVPRAEPDIQRQLADRHFRLAEALGAQSNEERLLAAYRHYLRAAEITPSLRHGWPLFLAASAADRLGREAEHTKSLYQRSAEIDAGRLALVAGYRIAALEVRSSTQTPIDPRPVQRFLRYVSDDLSRDLAPFNDARWKDRPEALYLEALLTEANGDADQAKLLMRGYAAERPGDPSGLYHLDRLEGWPGPATYPADGDISDSVFAPLALGDAPLILPLNAECLADAYFTQPPGHFTLTIRYRVSSHIDHTLTVRANGQARAHYAMPDESHVWQGEFSAQEHNQIWLQFTSNASDEKLRFYLDELRIAPSDAALEEPAS